MQSVYDIRGLQEGGPVSHYEACHCEPADEIRYAAFIVFVQIRSSLVQDENVGLTVKRSGK